MKELLSSRLLLISCGGSAHVLVAIGFGRLSPRSDDPVTTSKHASAALPQSRKLREVSPSRQVPLFSCVLWPTRLKTRPNIYSGSSRGLTLSDVTMIKITENAALHPNEDPLGDCSRKRSVQHGSRSRSPSRVWSSSRLDAGSSFAIRGKTFFALLWLARLAPKQRRPPRRPFLLRPSWPPWRP